MNFQQIYQEFFVYMAKTHFTLDISQRKHGHVKEALHRFIVMFNSSSTKPMYHQSAEMMNKTWKHSMFL